MLELRNIKKEYIVAQETFRSFKGINLSVQDKNSSPSRPVGCGKTNLAEFDRGFDQ
jgi:ABC-type lipoprotein export system ATPase subunit